MNDLEKRSLMDVYETLRFVDDVREWTCARCKRVLIHNYVSDCGHLFCHSCQEGFKKSLGFRCPQCQNTVLQMHLQNEEVEKKVLDLNVHCLNYKYGCNVVLSLKNLMGHCKVCKDTCRPSLSSLYKSRNPLETVARQMSSLSQIIRYQNEDSREFSQEMLRTVRTGFEELLEKQTQKFQNQLSNLDRKMRVLEKQRYDRNRSKDEDLAQEIQLKLKNEIDLWLQTISKDLEKPTIMTDYSHNHHADENEERERALIAKIMNEMEEKFKSFQTQIINTLNQQRNVLFPLQQQQRNLAKKKRLNILLLGESGSGKSALINAFANHAHYATFADACQGPEVCPIPTKFIYNYEDEEEGYKDRLIKSTEWDPNESDVMGHLGTLSCKSYVFSLDDCLDMRWIDCPGFCSSEDNNYRDEEIVREVVDYVEQFRELHAIAIVMKNNEARATDKLLYALQQILSIFHKSALPNFIFIFSHGNTPKDALPTVKAAMTSMAQHLSVGADFIKIKNNVFCFQNEAYQNILLLKAGVNLLEQVENEHEAHAQWKANGEEFAKLTRYVQESVKTPHDFSFTVQINEMRNYLRNLNSVMDYVERRKERAPSIKDVRKPDTISGNNKLEAEKAALVAAAAKIFHYVRSNAVLAKNFKLTDYAKTLNHASRLEIDRHVVTTVQTTSIKDSSLLLYSDIYEVIMKPLILLDVSGPKLQSLCNVDVTRRSPRFHANREVIVSQENAVVFNII